jgi:hypothetical protein
MCAHCFVDWPATRVGQTGKPLLVRWDARKHLSSMALHDLEAWLPSPQAWPCDIGTTECSSLAAELRV